MATVKPDSSSRDNSRWIPAIPATMEQVADAIFRTATPPADTTRQVGSDGDERTERQAE